MSVNAERLTVIGLILAVIPRMFTIDYDGRTVSAQRNSGVPEALQPELLLNDVGLHALATMALQQALEHTSWAVAEPDPRTRRLTRGGGLVAEVRCATADPQQAILASRTRPRLFDHHRFAAAQMMRGAPVVTMGSKSLQIPIAELILQRDDMLLIDCLHDYGAEYVEVDQGGSASCSGR